MVLETYPFKRFYNSECVLQRAYMSLCMRCVLMRGSMRECVCACGCVCVRVSVCVYVYINKCVCV